MFVISELGKQARSLLGDVIPLARNGNRYLVFYALEVIAVCALGDDAAEFFHVILALESEDNVLRTHAMNLIANADLSQIEAGARSLNAISNRSQMHDR